MWIIGSPQKQSGPELPQGTESMIFSGDGIPNDFQALNMQAACERDSSHSKRNDIQNVPHVPHHYHIGYMRIVEFLSHLYINL